MCVCGCECVRVSVSVWVEVCVCVCVCEYLTKLTVRVSENVQIRFPYITGKMSTEKTLLVKCPMEKCLMGNCHGIFANIIPMLP